jgi:prepilin-type N-terminal cleavage/methylation domain-containing protein
MQRRHASNLVARLASRGPVRSRRSAFTLLETLIVLVLLLSLAAIAIPAAADWFASRSDEQVRENIASLVRDQQLECIATRTPRVVWVGVIASQTSRSLNREGDSALRSARWSLGAKVLASDSPRDAAGASETPRRALLELPSGWSVDLTNTRSPTSVEAMPDASESSTSPNPVTPAESVEPAPDNADVIILWPHGQIDQPRPLVVVDASGVSWKLSLNPWTGAASWSEERAAASSSETSVRPASSNPSQEP